MDGQLLQLGRGSDTNVVVFYHAECADGFGAAWAYWCYNPRARFVPSKNGSKPQLPLCTGKHVVCLDFCWNDTADIEAVANHAKTLTIVDHHKTTKNTFDDWEGVRPNNIVLYLDMERSGFGLTWDRYMKRPRPWVADYVEQHDLGKDLDDRKALAVCHYIYDQPREFSVWSYMAWGQTAEDQQVRLEGRAIQRHVDQQVALLVKRTATFQLSEGHEPVPAVNTPVYMPEVAQALLVQHPNAAYAIAYRVLPSGGLYVSMRSDDDRADVGAIAEGLGGGGHRNAAGVRLLEGATIHDLRALTKRS